MNDQPYNHLLRVAEMLADSEQPAEDDAYNAWEWAMKYFSRNAPDEVRECIRLVEAYYKKPGNACGGPLHIVLDDDNVQDEHLAFCRAEAVKQEDSDGVAICDMMAKMPQRYRRIVTMEAMR